MSRGFSSISNNLPISKDSSRSSSPFSNYALYESETNINNNNINYNNIINSSNINNSINSRFKAIPVLIYPTEFVDMENMDSEINNSKIEQTPRRKFEVEKVVEKVEEKDPLLLNTDNKNVAVLSEIQNNNDTHNSHRSDHSTKSALKKTQTKFEYDDSIDKQPVVPKGNKKNYQF